MVSVAKLTAYEALRAVLQHEEPTCIETLKRDMERARMRAEDIRAHAGTWNSATQDNIWALMQNVAADHRGAQQETLAIIDVDTSSSRAVLSTAFRRANNAMVDAYRNLVPHGEDEDEMEAASESEEEDHDPADDLQCVPCHPTNGNERNFYNMEPEGRWAGLAPGARIVCSVCFRQDMGRVESLF